MSKISAKDMRGMADRVWRKSSVVTDDAADMLNALAAEREQAVVCDVNGFIEVGWVCQDGFPALLGHKPLPPKTKLYAVAPLLRGDAK